MSPLYGAAFLWLVATILWWSGWREESTDALPQWAVGLFLALWPLAWLGQLPVTETVSVNGASVWTMLSVLAIACLIPAARRWTAVSGGLLIGSLSILAARLTFLPSGYSPEASSWAIAAWVGWLVALLFRSVSEQVLAISVGLGLNAAAFAFLRSQDALPAMRAEDSMQAWWIALFSARLWTIGLRAAGVLGRKWALKLNGRRGGQRS
ncbi:hypothetical protein [Cohnella hongkongensis]|uniref:Uncharacterized protein n=1 Tax=Cohnella hongkongensis TaxID=178337 RepID=A0ABV9FGA0_9BACL